MEEIVNQIKDAGGIIRIVQNDLKIRFPKDYDNKSLFQKIKENRNEIIDFISNNKFIHVIPDSEYYDLSSSQFRLWVLSQTEQGSYAYNMPGVFKLEGELDVLSFESSFVDLINRHESLRTVFKQIEDGTVKQFVRSADEIEFKIEHGDLRSNLEELESAIRVELNKVFDLERGPLLTAKLLRLDNENYVFVFVMHHIISDGWSINVLINDLLTFYNAKVKAEKHTLLPLRIQYKDYAAWQLNQLNGRMEVQKNYWLKKFEGNLPLLALSIDKERPLIKTYKGNLVHYKIRQDLIRRFNELTQTEGVTLFMGLLGLINTLLFKYTGQEDIIIGSPISGREHADLKNQIGFYVNTLALRTNFSSENSFRELLNNIKENALGAYENATYPFDALVEKLNLTKDLSRNPLFDVMVVLQNNEVMTDHQKMDKVMIKKIEEIDPLISKVDLTFYFEEKESGINSFIEYNSDLFNEPTIHRLKNHLVQLLEEVVKDFDQKLIHYDYLSFQEKEQLLKELDLRVDYPKDKTLVDLFEYQVERTPDKVALVFEGVSLTYRELNEQTNELGNYLRSCYGIKPDDLIGIKLGRSERMIIAILGALKSGGAYVPMDPDYPQDRIAYMQEDSGCKVIIDESIINLAKLSGCSRENPIKNTRPVDIAYVIYTSGSTGRPKGVMVEHRNVVRLFKTDKPLFDFTDEDVWTMFHSYCFDFSVWEMYGALLFGGKLILVSSLTAKDPKKFLKLILKEGVTVLNQTPSSFYQLMNEEVDMEEQRLSLRYVIFGGEALSPIRLKSWHEKHPSARLINMYGITETTVHVTYKELSWDDIEGNVSNIGKPIPTLGCYVLDDQMRLLPIGVSGELYVCGEGVARGYLNREQLTKERFIENPFDKGNLLYRTGDIAKILPEGDLVYIGRKDDQVKIRGYRIELGEIELQLKKHTKVKEAIAVVSTNLSEEKHIIVYITSDEELNSGDLRLFLKGVLPPYMLPSQYVQLKKIPLTSNGKVDKKKLPYLPGIGMSIIEEYVAPSSDIEKQIVSIWQDILEKDNIGVYHDFFELGGDSIKAIRVVSKINRVLQKEILNVGVFYQCLNVSNLAKYISENIDVISLEVERERIKKRFDSICQKLKNEAEVKGIEISSWEDIYPMSSIELGMLIQGKLESGVYHDQIYHQIIDLSFNMDHFTKALQFLIRKHDTLRSSYFISEFDTPAKVIHKPDSVHVEILYRDLSRESKDNQKLILIEEQKMDIASPFEETKPGLWRVKLFQLNSSEIGMLLICHHAILDGWSVASLTTELSQLYYGLKRGEVGNLKLLSCTYKDAVIDQYVTIEDQRISSFWKKEIENCIRNSFPLYPHKKEFIKSGVRESIVALGSERSSRIRKNKKGYNPKHLFLSAYLRLIQLTTNEQLVAVGLVSNFRSEVTDGDKVLGCFLNTLPFCIDFSKLRGASDVEFFVDQKVKAIKQMDKFPLLEMVKWQNSEINENPYYNTMFNYIDFHIKNKIDSEIKLTDDETARYNYERTEAPLLINISSDEKEFSIIWKYQTNLYSEIEINRLSEYLIKIIDLILEGEYISSEMILNEEEKRKLLYEFNNTYTDYAREKTLTELFEEQVEKTPNNIALVFEEKVLSYRDLNAHANQLANYLRSVHQIKADDLIGIKLERSDLMIISMLGVLKSGGAYVPIDPVYPKERINYMLEDSNCNVLIDEEFLNIFQKRQESSLFKQSEENVPTITDPGNLAYVIYTSGSTGKPKGVMIEHKNAVAFISWSKEEFKNVDYEVMYAVTSICFDLSVYEIFYPLSIGKKLRILKNGLSIGDQITGESKVFINTVPSVLGALLSNGVSFENVVALNLAGEPIPKKYIEKIDLKKLEVRNLYGPSEDTTYSTNYRITDANKILIGSPISNTQIYILGMDNTLQPIGVIGEIYIGGDGLARGYLNKAELTEEKFISHPFKKGERLYKTGDLGRWQEDGDIEFLGRKDNQVKIRGYRIELGEIESCLDGILGVLGSVVSVHADASSGDRSLVGYVKLGEGLSVKSLRDLLSKSLPGYMLPSHFVELEEIPLTSNGKVDRKRLPLFAEDSILSDVEYIGPRNTKEQVFCSIFSSVLKVPLVSLKDNFFELGGDSIKSIILVSRFRSLGYSLGVKDIMEHPVLMDLFPLLKEITRAIPQESIHGEIGSTPIQKMFFSQPGNKHHYNQSVLLRSRFYLSMDHLQLSLNKLILHHDILRARYNPSTGQGYIHLAEDIRGHYQLEEIDLRENLDYLKVLEEKSNSIQRGLNIEVGPLFRCCVFRCPDGDRVLLVVHHLLIDGVSWRIILEDISTIYSQVCEGKEIRLPLKTDSFKYWQEQLLSYSLSSALGEEAIYWDNIEKSVCDTIVLDNPLGTNQIKNTNSSTMSLSKEISSLLLNEGHRAYNTNMRDILLTGLSLALKDSFSLNKQKINIEGHGREDIGIDIDISRTVGWFTSIYPVLLSVSSLDVEENIVSVKEALHRVPNNGIGYGVLKYLREEPQSILIKEPQIVFNYLGDFGSGVDNYEGSQVFEYASESSGLAQDSSMERSEVLLVTVFLVEGVFRINFSYSREQYNASTMAGLLSSYRSNLDSIVRALLSREGRMITPVDLTYKGLSISELKEIQASGDIEDVYVLSPMQQGLYSYWLSSSNSSVYFEQLCYRLEGHIDLDKIKQSYECLLSRHSVLRTIFSYNYGLGTPLQIVLKTSGDSYSLISIESGKDKSLSLSELKQQDISKGFSLEETAPIRLTVVAISDHEYEFIWSNHHILMDGWCIGLLIKEFIQIYNSLLHGSSLSLSPSYLYSDYIRWISKVDKSATLAYWREYLDGYDSLANLPFNTSSRNSDIVLTEVLEFSEEETARIKLFNKSQGITENVFVQSLWGVLLSKYNDTHDVVFGSIVSGRPGEIEGISDMIGLFINTIPVRIKYDKTTSVKELLNKIQEDWLNGTNHHYVELSEVWNESVLGNKLFDHIIIFENYPIQDLLSSEVGKGGIGIKIKTIEIFEQTNFNFSVIVSPGKELKLEFKYNAGKYDSTTVSRIKAHYRQMVLEVLSTPEIPIINLSYIDKADRSLLLHGFNSTTYDYPREKTLLDLFEYQVAESPDEIALVYGSKEYTYGDLNARSNELGLYLRKAYGIKPDDLIGINLERSDRMIVSILGVLKSGGAYVPIDPEYPQDRIDYILSDSSCKVLIDEEFLRDFAEEKTRILSGYRQENLSKITGPKDLAYVIYTSGSTGNPKGCMLEHQGIVNRIEWMWHEYKFSKSDVILQKTTNTFDVSVWEIFLPLCWGAKMVLCDRDDIYSPSRISSLIESHKVTSLHFVPSMLKAFLNEGLEVSKLTTLQRVITSGETLSVSTVSRWYDLMSVPIYNLYGPTEASIDVTHFPTEKGNDIIPIGKPIWNTQMYILGSSCELLPIGVVGEICIGGEGLARGYLNKPELTSEKFIKNPFKEGERLYKTGDLGRWKEDGNIEYIGRKDNQVKVRGYRIELGEIESCLGRIAGVLGSVVAVHTNSVGDKSLIGYVKLEEGLNVKSLRDSLSKSLPGYMLPSHFVELEEIPLTSNGKVDRKRLPLATGVGLSSGLEYVGPSNELEEKLVEIWSEVLDIDKDKIGVTDDFFDLGGHSLMLGKIKFKLENEFGIVFNWEDMYKTRNIYDLAFIIQAQDDVWLSNSNDEVEEIIL